MEREKLVAALADPLPFLADDQPAIRRLAISVCSTDPARYEAELGEIAISDPEPSVRALAVEALTSIGSVDTVRDDSDDRVREAAATAYGEIGSDAAVDWLIESALGDEDRLVQEAAVAALGAIGDDRALPVLLELVTDGPPRVRRRAVVALTVFDDPAIEPAIRKATTDRNPGVREAAEMVVGRESRVASRETRDTN